MKVAIVDNEDLQRETIYDLLSNEMKKYDIPSFQIDTFRSGSELFENFESDLYSIIILDIYMDDELGIDVARQIRKIDEDVILIFCTTSNEFASESYEVNARYYLHKPLDADSIHQMVERLKLTTILNQPVISLPDQTRVRLNHIMYTKYNNHKITLNLSNGHTHTLYMNQQEIEELLDIEHNQFYKINRGMLVNFAHVKTIQNKDFLMKNGITLPISRSLFKPLQNAFMDYKMQTL